jgi:D-lactate dehydrogenase (cytochrome)
MTRELIGTRFMAKITTLPRNEAGIKQAIAALRPIFGDRVQTGAAICAQHGHVTNRIPNQPPDAVVFALTTPEVARIVTLCAHHNVPVIPYGTGTSMEGHVNAPAGGICVDLSRMTRIVAVNPGDMDCVVEAGVTRKALNVHLRDQGLFFPVDPGADASLGGMASTRASGTNAVRYGTMKDNVLAMTVVMPDGGVIRTAARARKSSAGYDLTRLLIGAEGTLGIITGLTLRLQGIPEEISSARCSFPSLNAAATAVMDTIHHGVPVARIELLDSLTVRAVNAYSHLSLPETTLLLLEFHGSPAMVAEQAALFGDIAAQAGGTDYASSTDPDERNRLWQARHDVYWATLQMRPGAKKMSTDICVPISRLADCITAAQQKTKELGFDAPILGHAGDGNFHVLLLLDEGNLAEVANAEHFVGWLNDLAILMDGTCTGEHGIGQGKIEYLARELGPATRYMAAIKAALDPGNIMNPGKIFAKV